MSYLPKAGSRHYYPCFTDEDAKAKGRELSFPEDMTAKVVELDFESRLSDFKSCFPKSGRFLLAVTSQDLPLGSVYLSILQQASAVGGAGQTNSTEKAGHTPQSVTRPEA